MSDSKKNSPGYEVSDARVSTIAYSGVGLLVLMAISFLLVFGILSFFQDQKKKRSTPISPLAETLRQPVDTPLLQVAPEFDIEVFHTNQDSLRNSSGWILREAGVARIPVERAVDLLLERGLPVRTDYREWQNEKEKK